MILSLGFLGTFLLNILFREIYISRRSELEKNVENFLSKKVQLGDYSGIRFLGISLENSKIIDKENINYEIKANNLYVGIMPLKSFLKRKWIIKVIPKQAQINIDRDFFKKKNLIKMLEVQKNHNQSMN